MLLFTQTYILPFVFFLTGITALLYALLKEDKIEKLKSTGEQCEGIIFQQSQKNNYSSDNSNYNDSVTVRFVTKKQEWITADMKQDFAIFYSGQYKDCDKVIVYYDPKRSQ